MKAPLSTICRRSQLRQNSYNIRLLQNAFTSTISNVNDNNIEDMSLRQKALYNEASSITRALYKRCLESIRVLAIGEFSRLRNGTSVYSNDVAFTVVQGNEQDEGEFAAREKSQFDESRPLSSISLLSPPVNRANELSSRANYYTGFCREHFEGHWNLLGIHGFHIDKNVHGMGYIIGGQGNNQYQGGHHHLGGQIASQYVGQYGHGYNDKDEDSRYYTWSEEQIQKFTYLVRSGEEKRAWILKDYGFIDPCIVSDWPHELERRLETFEKGANLLVRDMYQERGWIHSSDSDQTTANMEHDSDDEEDL